MCACLDQPGQVNAISLCFIHMSSVCSHHAHDISANCLFLTNHAHFDKSWHIDTTHKCKTYSDPGVSFNWSRMTFAVFSHVFTKATMLNSTLLGVLILNICILDLVQYLYSSLNRQKLFHTIIVTTLWFVLLYVFCGCPADITT